MYHQPSEKFAKPFDKKTDKLIELNSRTIKSMAHELIRHIISLDLFHDTVIYYRSDGRWISCSSNRDSNRYTVEHKFQGKTYTWYERKDDDPNDYFEYNGHILSASFEGPLCHSINSEIDSNMRTQLNNFFSHYGLYYELGNQWNLSLYEA